MSNKIESVVPICICLDNGKPRIEIEVEYEDQSVGRITVPILPIVELAKIVRPIGAYLEKHGFKPE